MAHDPGDDSSYDVVVVGGSLAGLQAALTVGRACRRVLVLDDGHPRNAPAARVNNFLGHDAVSPAQLLASARAMLSALDVEVVAERVLDGEQRGLGGWQLVGSSGRRWSARTVVLALLLSRWSDDVRLLTQGEVVDDQQADRLDRSGVDVETRALVRVASDQDGLVLTPADRTALARRSLFVSPPQRQQSDLSRRLGCRAAPSGGTWVVETDASGRTSVPGVWAAGTTAQPAQLGIAAAGAASTVAVALHAALLEQDLADPALRPGPDRNAR